MSALCSAAGCDKKATSKGLCQTHYMRLWRHGDIEDHRPNGYGSKIKHPMYIIWKAAKQEDRICQEWESDFWRFVEEAGPRPDMKHNLCRLDESKPFGPGNAVWRARLAIRKDGESDKEYFARYQRIRRKLLPEETRKTGLRRVYGITPEQYQELHDAQHGKCAICGRPERATANGGMDKKVLAVDHCHDTGEVRGLLCQGCNVALGGFDDSQDLLFAAIAYLRAHSERRATGKLIQQNREFEWPEHQAKNGMPKVYITTPDGQMDVNDAAKKYGLTKNTIMWRLRNGWSEEDLLRPPAK